MEHIDINKFMKNHSHITKSLSDLCDYVDAHKDIDPRVKGLIHSVLGAIHGGNESIQIYSDYMVQASKKILETLCDEGSN